MSGERGQAETLVVLALAFLLWMLATGRLVVLQ